MRKVFEQKKRDVAFGLNGKVGGMQSLAKQLSEKYADVEKVFFYHLKGQTLPSARSNDLNRYGSELSLHTSLHGMNAQITVCGV